jgi:NADH-ubiquinone oxidoreductase chain 5
VDESDLQLVIYYQNVKSYGAGILTVLSNRIGDVALLIVITWIINFGTRSFIYYLEFLSGSTEMELISFLVLAAITRSAQIPFSPWLPAAMAAPAVPTHPRRRQVTYCLSLPDAATTV